MGIETTKPEQQDSTPPMGLPKVAPVRWPARPNTGAQAPVDAPDPAPAKKSPLMRLTAFWPVALIAIVAGGFYLFTVSDINRAAVGDCASFDPLDDSSPYSRAGCGSDSATLRVLQLIPVDQDCREVAGATQSTRDYSADQHVVACLGPKDADPAAALNLAKPGDCLTGADERAHRVACDSPAVAFTILERFNDVAKSQASTMCTNVPRATAAYSWNWDIDQSGPQIQSLEVDAVFCLERVKR
jgi:hypothetical protein